MKITVIFPTFYFKKEINRNTYFNKRKIIRQIKSVYHYFFLVLSWNIYDDEKLTNRIFMYL